MDLVERYLAAIGRELPAAQAGDVVAELRDVLLSQIEEAEERLGRPLAAKEVEQLLSDFGHPLIVAGRYRKIQHLVGSEVFPFWWAGLKASLTVASAVVVVLLAVRLVTGAGVAVFWHALPMLWSTALYVFAVVTLVAVGLEQAGAVRLLRKWRPGGLPPVGVTPRSRFDLVVEIGMGLVFLLWWVGALRFHNFIPDYAQIEVNLAPVWSAHYWPILGYAAADIAVNVLALTHAGWRRGILLLSAARYVAGGAILLSVLQAGRWATISGTRPAAELTGLQEALDLALRLGLVALISVFAVKAAVELWRGVRGRDIPLPMVRGLRLSL